LYISGVNNAGTMMLYNALTSTLSRTSWLAALSQILGYGRWSRSQLTRPKLPAESPAAVGPMMASTSRWACLMASSALGQRYAAFSLQLLYL